MQSPYRNQNQNQQLFIQQNGQMIPVIVVTNRTNGQSPYSGSIVNVRDYLAWSIVKVLCCYLLFGLCALALSLKTRKKKRSGDLQGAKKLSKWAGRWNALSAIAGIIATTLLILDKTGAISI